MKHRRTRFEDNPELFGFRRVAKRSQLALARIMIGEQGYQPKHRVESSVPKFELPARKVRTIRSIATLALGVGLAVSFNGAKSVDTPEAPYYDLSRDCSAKGFQTVDTPPHPLEQVDSLYEHVKLRDWLTADQCRDEFYEVVRSQVEPAFAMDIENGFTVPDTLILPRSYVFDSQS